MLLDGRVVVSDAAHLCIFFQSLSIIALFFIYNAWVRNAACNAFLSRSGHR
jgi:hypothetical protein